MKKKIHPKYNNECKVKCACGNNFVTGSTQDAISVEICNKCHPFFTGTQKLIDSARRVEKFEAKKANVMDKPQGKTGKRAKLTAKKIKRAKKHEGKEQQAQIQTQ